MTLVCQCVPDVLKNFRSGKSGLTADILLVQVAGPLESEGIVASQHLPKGMGNAAETDKANFKGLVLLGVHIVI